MLRHFSEIPEKLAEFFKALMVETDIVEHRNLGPEKRDRPVTFINFGHKKPASTNAAAGEG